MKWYRPKSAEPELDESVPSWLVRLAIRLGTDTVLVGIFKIGGNGGILAILRVQEAGFPESRKTSCRGKTCLTQGRGVERVALIDRHVPVGICDRGQTS